MNRPRLHRAPSGRRGERGATLVEYALGVAVVIVVAMVGASLLGDEAEGRLRERGASTGHPGDEAVGGAAAEPPPGGGPVDDGEVDPPPAPAPYAGAVVNEGCEPDGSSSRCAFSLSLDPAPDVPVWSVNPSNHTSGVPTSGPTATISFSKHGTYTVRALVGSREVPTTVTCTKSGPQVSCAATSGAG